MATDKQIAANRANAQKSTGPRTEAGKAKSRFNATMHGLSAKHVVLPGEGSRRVHSPAGGDLRGDLQPTDRLQAEAAAQIAANLWLLRRIPRLKAALAMWGTYKRVRLESGPFGQLGRDEDAEKSAEEEIKAQYPGQTPEELQQMKALGEFLDKQGLSNLVRLVSYQNSLSRQIDRDLDRLAKRQSRSITMDHAATGDGVDMIIDEAVAIEVAPEAVEEPGKHPAELDA